MAKQTVIVSVLADTKKFTSGFNAAGKSTTSLIGKVGKLGLGVVAAGAAAASTVAVLALKGGFDRALKIDQAQAKLRGLGYDMDAVKGVTDDTLKAVRGTAYSLQDGMTIAGSALAAGVKQGVQLEQYLKNIGDAAAIAGTDLNSMGSIFNKIQASGRLTGETLTQMQERGLPVLSWLQKAYGKSADEMRKMVSRGEIDSAAFNKVIQENIGGAALSAGDTVQGAFANMRAAMGRAGAAAIQGSLPVIRTILSAATSFFDFITDRIQPMAEQFWAWISTLKDQLLPVWDRIKTAAAPFVQILQSIIGQFTDANSPLANFAKQLIELWQTVSPISVVFRALQPLMGQIVSLFQRLGTTVFEGVGQILPKVLEVALMLNQVFQQAITAVFPIVVQLMESLGRVFEALIPIVMQIIEFVLEIVEALMPFTAALIELLEAVLPPVIAILEWLIGVLIAVVGAVLDLLIPAIQFLISVLATVGEWITKAVTWFVKLVTGSEDVWKGIKDVWDTILDFFASIPGLIMQFFSDAGQWLFSIGEDIMNGLWAGLESIWNGLVGWIEDIGQGIADTFAWVMGIQSPSKVFKQFGKDTMKGLQIGLQDLSGVRSAAANAAEELQRSFGNPEITATASTAGGLGGNVYNIEINSISPSPEVGRAVVQAIEEYDRLNGARR